MRESEASLARLDMLQDTSPVANDPEASVAHQAGEYVRWLREDLSSGRWMVDLAQPSLLYKVYQNVERFPLDGNVPLQLGKDDGADWWEHPRVKQASREQKLAWLLYYTHGLTRMLRPEAGKPATLSSSLRSPHSVGSVPVFAPFLGRPVPSGGDLHPTELYVALGTKWHMPSGIYHYNPVQHALERLRDGDFLSAIGACLPTERSDFGASARIFTTVCLQKNHQKYTDLAYLLQTLDTGIVLEQLHFISRHLQMSTASHLRFLDAPLHYLLGLATSEELIYAVLSLADSGSPEPAEVRTDSNGSRLSLSRPPGALLPLSSSHLQPFQPRAQSSLLRQLYAASLLDTLGTNAGLAVQFGEVKSEKETLLLPARALPSAHDIAQVLLRRHTNSQSIDTRPLSLEALAVVLEPLAHMERSCWIQCDCQLYCVVSSVSSLEPGVYRYQPEKHALGLVQSNAPRALLMRLSTGINIHPHISPLNLFFCGDYQRAEDCYGGRGLRVLGITLGRALQTISLGAASHNMGTHIHLSFAMESTRKRLLGIPDGTCMPLASMMVGYIKSARENLFEPVWY